MLRSHFEPFIGPSQGFSQTNNPRETRLSQEMGEEANKINHPFTNNWIPEILSFIKLNKRITMFIIFYYTLVH